MTDRRTSGGAPKPGRDWPQWQRNAAWSVFFLAMTGFFYWYFTDFESSKESSRSMNWIFATLYNIGGKYLVCGLCLAGAAAWLALAIRDFGRRDDASTPASPGPSGDPRA